MDVHDRITQLEAELAKLKNHVMGDSPGGMPAATEGDDGRPTSRRQMLKLAGAAAVGAAGASLATAPSAGATTGTMMFGKSNDAMSSQTVLTSSATFQTLTVDNTRTRLATNHSPSLRAATAPGYLQVGSCMGSRPAGTWRNYG